jgi:hypothetical protein
MREELFKLISSKVKNFTKLSNNQKLYYILTCENQEILQSVALTVAASFIFNQEVKAQIF